MSLVEHAKKELYLLNNDDAFNDCIIKAVEAFASYGHSGGSAGYGIHALHDLLQFKNLSPLTDDPNEWMEISYPDDLWPKGQWQSCRNPEAFSGDGGKTYYLISEVEDPQHPDVFHASKTREGV